MNTPGSVYLNDDHFRIPFSQEMRESVQEQLRDNKGAMYARLQAIALQVSGQSVNEADLLCFLCEMPVSTSTITDNFAIDPRELMAIRNAEPISVVSCLKCRAHLRDGDRRTFLRQLRILRHLGRFEVGDLVDFSIVCELLCDVCSSELRLRYEEQLQAERLARQARKAQLCRMPFEEYRKTPEWQSRRNRALIRAGNRCVICGPGDKPLDVHHNSYERYGDELLEDLTVLCHRCHQRFHGILPNAA